MNDSSDKLTHTTVVDYLRTHLPYESKIRVYAKRMVEDTTSVIRWFKPWRHLAEGHPSTLQLETTNICNANCIFCAYQYQENFRTGTGYMSDEILERALTQFKDMGGQDVEFTPLVGDALVDPQIIPRVKHAKDLGFQWVHFYTNGILFNKIDVDALIKTGVDTISLSTGPFDETIWTQLYRNSQYKNLILGIKKLLKARNELNPNMKFSIVFRSSIPYKELVELPDYRNEIMPLMTEKEREDIYVLTKGFDTWGSQIKKEDLIGIMDLALPPLIKRRPCLWTFTMKVMWDGKVRACACRFEGTEMKDGNDGLMVGDLHHASLRDIWHGAEMEELRNRFVEGNLPTVCATCTMYKSC